MLLGGRRELIIPPALADASHANRVIPGNAMLVLIVDELAVTPPKSTRTDRPSSFP
jgi:FKBP-type peptidyl-prolyl cis-trans isomerase